MTNERYSHNAKNGMYELEYPAPAVNTEGTVGPTLIVALHGYADAGQAVESSADHLKAALENRLVASFNADELIDYRSRRPATTIDTDKPIEIDNLDLDMRVLRDVSDTPFLLLSGPEPDLRWQSFTKAVSDLVERFNVTNTIVLYGAPSPAPHTRPLVISAHGNDQKLVGRMFRFDSTMIVPGSAQLYIERELAKKDRNVAGYTAHVPHYLAASTYPEAVYKLLDAVSRAASLDLPLRSLEHDVERFETHLAEQVSQVEELDQIVQQLEHQYDSFVARYRTEHPQAILPGEENVPSGEEISAEFQRFLDAIEQEDSWREHFLREDINDREDEITGPEDGPAPQD